MILPTLPIEWKEYLTSDEFIDSAMDKFDALDADGNGGSSRRALVPVVAELSQAVLGTSTKRTAAFAVLRRRQERVH